MSLFGTDRAPTHGRGRRPVVRGALTAIALLVVLTAAIRAAEPATPAATPATNRPLPLEIVPAGVDEVFLEPVPSGEVGGEDGYRYRVEYRDGRVEHLSPRRFAELLYTQFSGRNRLFALFNITSAVGIAWVALGFLGQILFSGRMLIQWLASERSRRSVVPVAFWWMSLGGASMLILYFVWRKDIVGVVGQATGWMIYLRNLRLIYRSAPEDAAASST